MTAAPSVRRVIPEIDGLRGIAILLVLCMHFWPDTGALSALWPAAQRGWMGVGLFFVISGFLITGILLDTRGGAHFFRHFYVRRVLRIFPLHYLFLAVVFVGVPLVQGVSYRESSVGESLGSPWWFVLYLSNIRQMIDLQGIPIYLQPLWSLAIEEQFYLVFPLLVHRLSPQRLPRVLLGVVALAFIVRTIMTVQWPTRFWDPYLFTFARFDAIALGCLAAVYLRRAPIPRYRSRYRWGLLAGAVLMLATASLTDGLDRKDALMRMAGYSTLAMAWTAVMVWAVAGSGDRATAWLRWAPLRFMGRLCFGLYVLHLAVREVVVRSVDRWAPGLPGWEVLQLPVLLLASVLVAWASWLVVEAPFQRLKSRFAYTPRSTSA